MEMRATKGTARGRQISRSQLSTLKAGQSPKVQPAAKTPTKSAPVPRKLTKPVATKVESVVVEKMESDVKTKTAAPWRARPFRRPGWGVAPGSLGLDLT